MSSKRGHSQVSTGAHDVQPSAARRPSTKGSSFAFENQDDAVMYESSSLTGRRVSKTADGAESDGSSDQTGRTRKKAEPVKSACVQCQKRKTKCSGQRPVCRFCSDRNLECSWDIGDGLTRTADLKRKLQEAIGRSDDLDTLVDAMRQGSDEVSTMLLAKLRCGFTIEDIVSNIRTEPSPGGSADTQSEPSNSQSTDR